MAVAPENQAFLREVDEELRRDQAARLWTRDGIAALVAVVAALIALAGDLFWQHRQAQAAGVEGETLQRAYDALGSQKVAEAAKPLGELATSDRDGYRALARFTQGDIQLQKNDLKGAAATFAAIAADEGVAQPFRDLATIRQTTAEFDTLKPDVVIQRLRGLAIDGNPWFGSAGELVAVSYMKQGRRDLAGKLFGQIAKAEGVPDTIRQRAVQMAGVLGVDAVQTPAAGQGANEDKTRT